MQLPAASALEGDGFRQEILRGGSSIRACLPLKACPRSWGNTQIVGQRSQGQSTEKFGWSWREEPEEEWVNALVNGETIN